jgi:pimeloyl-ACP methyl ester carboxylesterase
MAADPGTTVVGRVEVGGASLAYELTGEAGPPLVLVHAGIADRRLWDAQVAAFAPQYRVLRYDLRGLGESTKPPTGFAHHEDLRGLLAALALRRAVVVGLSLGSRVALDVALAYPALTAALVLAAPALGGYPVSAAWEQYEVEEEAALERGDLPAAVELNLRMWVDGPRRDPAAVAPGVRARATTLVHDALARPPVRVRPGWLTPPAIGRLREVRTPTLVVVGDQDVPDVLAIADRLAAAIPGARRVVVPGAAHLVNLEAAEVFNRVVLEFLAEQDTR